MRKLLLSVALLAVVGSASAIERPKKGQSVVPQKKVNKIERVMNGQLAQTPVKKQVAQARSAKAAGWVSPSQLPQLKTSRKPSLKAPLKAADEGYIWWHYSQAQNLGISTYAFSNHIFWIRVPSSLAGAQVDSVSTIFYDGTKIKNLKFIAYPIEYDSEGYIITPKAVSQFVDLIADADESKIKSCDDKYVYNTDYKLDALYTIPANGCFIGYMFDDPDAATKVGTAYGDYPVVYYKLSSPENGSFFLQSTEEVDANGDLKFYNQYSSGALPLQIHVNTSNIPENNAAIGGIPESIAKVGTSASVPVFVYNEAFGTVANIGYTVKLNGEQVGAEQTFDFTYGGAYDGIAADGYDVMYLSVANIEEGLNDVEVEITKVNGKANLQENYRSDEGTIIGVAEPAERVNFVEEATGTWCGWCPRGTVGIKNLNSKLGDNVVTIAVHMEDTMDCNYLDFSNAPTAYVNRMEEIDPYYGIATVASQPDYNFQTGEGTIKFTADQWVEAIANEYPSEVVLDLDAEWADDALTTIKATVTSTFAYDRLDAPYQLGFVLVEDGQKGEDNGTDGSWDQANYYSSYWGTLAGYFQQASTDADFLATLNQAFGTNLTAEQAAQYATEYARVANGAAPFNDTDMADYISGDTYVEQVYDNVAIGTLSANNAITAPIELGVAQTYTTTIDITPLAEVIQDKANLRLVAYLLNTNAYGPMFYYGVSNAAQKALGVPAGIRGIQNSTDSNNAEVARFSVDGKRLSAPQKGLNIVKLADGTVVKVMVK